MKIKVKESNDRASTLAMEGLATIDTIMAYLKDAQGYFRSVENGKAISNLDDVKDLGSAINTEVKYGSMRTIGDNLIELARLMGN